ncbi:MAG: sigma-54-dependent transcriptional regulator [Pirellulales bacterium]
MPSVLVIDDDDAVLQPIREVFNATEISVLTAGTAADGLHLLEEERPDVVLLDVMLPEASGLEIFQWIHEMDPRLPIIFVTAGGTSETAIEAMKLGAYDYLLKPLDLVQVQRLVRQALEMRHLMQAPITPSDAAACDDPGDILVGRSPQMLEVYKAVGRVAPQDITVLIRGESGTGKELFARAIYQHSRRSDQPFLAVNCAAIPDSLLESELFGHEKGSFTGAENRRIGKFEQCSGGTVFLDEVGDMSPLVQSKVLRLLQGQSFERVGGNEAIQTDVRVIAATNRDLETMVAEGKFRNDLYYRLNDFTINLPPLREREDDIPLLLEHFLARLGRELGKELHGISSEALQLLVEYRWPGNVREMQSALKYALLHTSGSALMADCLPAEIRAGRKARPISPGEEGAESDLGQFVQERLQAGSHDLYAETLAMMERYVLTHVLQRTGGNQSTAAKILGITRGSLRNKIRAFGISIGHVVHLDYEPAGEVAVPV